MPSVPNTSPGSNSVPSTERPRSSVPSTTKPAAVEKVLRNETSVVRPGGATTNDPGFRVDRGQRLGVVNVDGRVQEIEPHRRNVAVLGTMILNHAPFSGLKIVELDDGTK